MEPSPGSGSSSLTQATRSNALVVSNMQARVKRRNMVLGEAMVVQLASNYSCLSTERSTDAFTGADLNDWKEVYSKAETVTGLSALHVYGEKGTEK